MKRAAALPMVLMSLGLVGALAVGGSFAARRIVADTRSDFRALGLMPATEQAIVAALSSLDSAALSAHQPGSTITRGVQVTAQVVTASWITALGSGGVWVVAEAATTTKPLLRNRLCVFAWLAPGEASTWSSMTWLHLP